MNPRAATGRAGAPYSITAARRCRPRRLPQHFPIGPCRARIGGRHTGPPCNQKVDQLRRHHPIRRNAPAERCHLSTNHSNRSSRRAGLGPPTALIVRGGGNNPTALAGQALPYWCLGSAANGRFTGGCRGSRRAGLGPPTTPDTLMSREPGSAASAGQALPYRGGAALTSTPAQGTGGNTRFGPTPLCLRQTDFPERSPNRTAH